MLITFIVRKDKIEVKNKEPSILKQKINLAGDLWPVEFIL